MQVTTQGLICWPQTVEDGQAPLDKGQAKVACKRLRLRDVDDVALHPRDHADRSETPLIVPSKVVGTHSAQSADESGIDWPLGVRVAHLLLHLDECRVVHRTH